MNKTEALNQLKKINNQFGKKTVPRLQTPGYVTTMDMVNLQYYLNPIIQAFEPETNYFAIPKFRERLQQILDHYGNVPQIIQSIEEFSELTKELTNEYKLMTNKTISLNRPQPNPFVLDEIADIYIMLGQLKLIFEIDENTIGRKIDEKLTRQINRIISA